MLSGNDALSSISRRESRLTHFAPRIREMVERRLTSVSTSRGLSVS